MKVRVKFAVYPFRMKRKQGDDGRDPAEGKTQPLDLIARLAREDVRQAPGAEDSAIDHCYALGDTEATVSLFRDQSEYGRSVFISSLANSTTNLHLRTILALIDAYPAYRNQVGGAIRTREWRNNRPGARRDPHASRTVALRIALAAKEENETVEIWTRKEFERAKREQQCPYPGTLPVMLDLVPALAAENKNAFPARELFSCYLEKGYEPRFLPASVTGLFSSDLMYVSARIFAWRTDLSHEIGNWEEFKMSRIMCKTDQAMLDEADETKVQIDDRDVSDCGLQLPDGKMAPFKHVFVNTASELAWTHEKMTINAGEIDYQISNVPDRHPVLARYNHSQERGDAMIDVRISKLYVATAGTRGRLVSEARVLEVDGKMIHEEKKEDAELVPTGIFVVDTENRRCFAFVVSQRVDVSPARANVPAGRQFADCLGQVFSLDDAVLVHYFNVDRVMVHRVEEALGVQYDIWSRGGDLGAIQVAFDSVVRP